MSGWLNFNESLNSIKGQITNFATNVLADEEGADATNITNEELKKICSQKDLEIEHLRKVNNELEKSLGISGQQNGERNEWDWTTPELTVENIDPKDDSPNLKATIKALEDERNDLLNQLEQLDSENQQNLAELVAIRENLQDENSELKDKNVQLKQQNKVLKTELSKLQKNDVKDSYQEKYESILKTNQELTAKLDETTTELNALKITHDTLKESLEVQKNDAKDTFQDKYEEILKINQELAAKLDETTTELSTLKSTHATLKNDVKEPTQEKYENILKTNQELRAKLDETTTELSALKSTHETLKKTFEDTKKSEENLLTEFADKLKKSESENKIIYNKLLEASELVKSAELKSQEDAENCRKLAFILESYDKQVSLLKEELASAENDQNTHMKIDLQKSLKLTSSLQNENTTLKADLDALKMQIEEQSNDQNTIDQEKENLHTMYVNIITDNIKRYIDSALLPSEQQYDPSENPHVNEFSRQVENIFKILLEFKQKCEALEKELIEASNEKTKILNEKYNEIEKLIQNSEVLSQEVIKKGETIKELESEISNLITSNDVLLSELDSYKNSGLQTISESNEDNMVILETDLENANKRIKELEEIIESPSKTSNNTSSNASLEIRVNRKQEDYQELLNSFDDLKIDYDDVACKLNETTKKLNTIEAENEDLKSNFEKIKVDFENTDYQLSEANFTIDSLKDELEAVKLSINTLQRENKELKLQNMNNIDIKTELNEIKEKYLSEENHRRELEAQLRILTEKQQSSKMTETSFKLQNDTLNKELVVLTEAKNTLEQSLASAKLSIAEYESNYTELLQKYDNVLLKCEELNTQMHEKESQLLKVKCMAEENVAKELEEIKKEYTNLMTKLKDIEQQKSDLEQLTIQQKQEIDSLVCKEVALQEALNNLKVQSIEPIGKEQLQEDVASIQSALKQSQENVASLQQQLQELANSRNDLINMVTIKHQENLNYHNEIQRLSDIVKIETQKYLQLEPKLLQANDDIAKKSAEIDKLTDQNNFLKEKCDILTKNLIEEQTKVAEKSGPSDKELSLSKQLERLQSHLMELEEHYTQELLQAEQKNVELQSKLSDLALREKNSSTMYTSISIRANQQVEALQTQLQTVTNQREDLRQQISDAEDLNNKQAAALANLQFVLEQFQKDKDKDVQKETERIRRQITAEKHVQDELKKEIENLKNQLEESKIGLQAASRLSDQLELLKKQNSGLKDEVSQLQQKLTKSQKTIHEITSQTDGKIDKSLIKSLIVGFLSSGNTNNWNKDQTQVLKLIATVLDFNQQDHDKVKLNRPQQGSWLGSLLAPQPHNQNMSQESLSQAFVKFLENESTPRVVPSLLQNSNTTESSKITTPTTSPSPIILNEIVLPTFADFGQSRNSSSILKDVLKDNNN